MNEAGKALARLVDTRALSIMAALYKDNQTDLADDIKRLVDKAVFDVADPEPPQAEVVALADGEAQVWVPYEPKASNANLYDVGDHSVRILRTVDADTFWSAVVGSGFGTYSWWHDYNFLVGNDEMCGQIEVKMWSDPEDHTSPLMVRTFTVEDLAAAFNAAVEQGFVDSCCNEPLDIDNFDACGGDIVMQMAVLGEVPYKE